MIAPKPPLMFSGNVDAAFVGGLLTFHAENVIVLPGQLVDCIRAADGLKRAEDTLGREIVRHDPSAVRRVVLDGLKEAAAAGRLPADAGAPAAEHQRDRATLDARYAIVRDAAAESGHELRAAIVTGADELGALLLGALEKLLREALEPAVVMRAAEPFNYADPTALFAAAKPVQVAFGRLVPLSALHDRLRRAAVALAGQVPEWTGIGDPAEAFAARQRTHAGAAPEWRRAGPFAGYGVDQSTEMSRDIRWRFAPVGHPIQRLVAAATDPELEPLAEPAPAAASEAGAVRPGSSAARNSAP